MVANAFYFSRESKLDSIKKLGTKGALVALASSVEEGVLFSLVRCGFFLAKGCCASSSAEFCADGFVPARPASFAGKSASVRRESCDGTWRNNARRSLSRRIYSLRQRPSAAAGINSRFLRSRSPIDPKREIYSFLPSDSEPAPAAFCGGSRAAREQKTHLTLGISTRRRSGKSDLSGGSLPSTQAGGRRA